MWIERDLLRILQHSSLQEAILVQGPRQVGKSSLLEYLVKGRAKVARLDDLAVRTRANTDPALFFTQYEPPVVIDEFQYAPTLLPEIKLRIDAARRARRESARVKASPTQLFYLSGSNQIDIDRAIKETLAGRISILPLHGLSISEIVQTFPEISLSELLWRGGFPELYVQRSLSALQYLNDYIATFVEKDVARSGGISKIEEFMTVTRLLAARVGGMLNYNSLANDAGVAAKTVSEWTDILVRMHIAYLLPVYSSNLNSRLIKTPKIYFLDTGIATRLQGHLAEDALLGAPQAGSLFENLVIAEVIKARDHLCIPCTLSYWRTKEKEEIDLVISYGDKRILLEVKLAIQGGISFSIPSSVLKEFGSAAKVALITVGGEREILSSSVERVPFKQLGAYLREVLHT